MAEKSQIAIYISLGSLAVSSLSFFFAVRQSKINKKNEQLRAYDKVYHDASDLLLFHYKNATEKPFSSIDKDLERAVNEYANAHWLEQTYGFNIHTPDSLKTDDEKREFNQKVRDTYYAFEREKQNSSFEEFINYQSPVFHLDNEEFSGRFNRLLNHVTENLSLFSPVIIEHWERMRFLTPEKVKNEYLSLKRVNENACEAIEEPVEDPYLRMLLGIRYEHRQLNMPLSKKWSELWFNISFARYRFSRIFKKFSKRDNLDGDHL
ncbi:conserved hypothetical protein [Oleispira antarctica RB-8]|uniref:Uncharacterized protein n=1 Tax=Oleispira antarctica RB-8 TaxID=698738 RepID=R4YMP6_OLEAN|nr:conserved hypothetical protein [Oleispira antarctica RB-8]